MKSTGTILLSILASLLMAPRGQAAYTEEYRPQFHFSPVSGSIGDPAGLIRYNNTYHLFWWGHAVSSDLVYWGQMVFPMVGGPTNIGYWSGSAVVDLQNTSGFGYPSKPAMVAVYTMQNATNQQETVGVSPSTNYVSFNYYGGNPVLTSDASLFRVRTCSGTPRPGDGSWLSPDPPTEGFRFTPPPT